MTILFDGRHRVNRNRRPFGLGVSRPGRNRLPFGPSSEDARWWAENSPSNAFGFEIVGPSDATFDAMACESAELDRLCRGPIF